jgi:hypothetical protein
MRNSSPCQSTKWTTARGAYRMKGKAKFVRESVPLAAISLVRRAGGKASSRERKHIQKESLARSGPFRRRNLPCRNLRRLCPEIGHLLSISLAGSEVTNYVRCPWPLGLPPALLSHPDRGLPVATPYQYRRYKLEDRVQACTPGEHPLCTPCTQLANGSMEAGRGRDAEQT